MMRNRDDDQFILVNKEDRVVREPTHYRATDFSGTVKGFPSGEAERMLFNLQ